LHRQGSLPGSLPVFAQSLLWEQRWSAAAKVSSLCASIHSFHSCASTKAKLFHNFGRHVRGVATGRKAKVKALILKIKARKGLGNRNDPTNFPFKEFLLSSQNRKNQILTDWKN
jgi:hypothetical protein